MVTEKKIMDTGLMRYQLGTILIWLGILTWLPFIVLRIIGEMPSLLWFLPFHLLGVVGGSRLRSIARKEMNVIPVKRNLLIRAGHTLIFLGILVWAPYFYLKIITQLSMDVMDFLPFHLTGILGGITLLIVDYWIGRREAR